MDVRNAWTIRREVGKSRHGGRGDIENWHLFESEDWESNLTIIGFDVLPPGTSIAEHPHYNEEKLYLVLEGTGIAIVDGEEQAVASGDAIPLRAGSSHGIRNSGTEPMMILVIECKLTREAKLASEQVPVELRGADLTGSDD